MTGIKEILSLVVKYGGLNLVLYLLLTWLFQQYFDVDTEIINFMLKLLLWYALGETIFIMVVSRAFWLLQKCRDFKEGKIVVEEINGKSVSNIGKEMGLDMALMAYNTVKTLLAKSPEEKERKDLEKQLKEIEKQIEKIESQ